MTESKEREKVQTMNKQTWLYHMTVGIFILIASALFAWTAVASYIFAGKAAFLAGGLILWPLAIYFMWKAYRHGQAYEKDNELTPDGRLFPWSPPRE